MDAWTYGGPENGMPSPVNCRQKQTNMKMHTKSKPIPTVPSSRVRTAHMSVLMNCAQL